MSISIVIPVYYGEEVLNHLVELLVTNVSEISRDYEIIMVEDGSRDSSWRVLERICQSNSKVKAIKLSRNFGQHYAITAGLEIAKAEWIVVMDCDLQDRPEEIPRLYKKAIEGYDMVLAKRVIREDRFLKRFSSKLFYRFFGLMTGTEQDASIANFGIYNKKVIDAVLSMKDHIRYFPAMVQWVGFKKSKLEVRHMARTFGKSTYSPGKLLRLAFNNIVSFSDRPLKMVVGIGLGIALISFIVGIYFFIKYLSGEIIVLGYTSIIISLWFLAGIIIILLGIIGLYLGKTFDRVKNRPLFIIQETINFNG